jgi:hypothetical protein
VSMLTYLSNAMRRLASWRILALTGAGCLGAVYLFFATSLPFAIPTVTALCNGAPPDMRFYTSAAGVREFLSGCGESGRLAYTHLQLADLLFPAIVGLFLACALSMVLVRLARPGSVVVAAAALPLLGSVFDYLENAAAWGALAAYPEPTMTAEFLGYASVAKQVCSWASWALLIVATLLLLIKVVRSRGSKRPSQYPPATARVSR